MKLSLYRVSFEFNIPVVSLILTIEKILALIVVAILLVDELIVRFERKLEGKKETKNVTKKSILGIQQALPTRDLNSSIGRRDGSIYFGKL